MKRSTAAILSLSCLGLATLTALARPAMDAAPTSQPSTQPTAYPLKTCLVSGEELGEMGDAIQYTYAPTNQQILFCCKGCVKKFEADPATYLKKLDAAK